MKFHNKKDYTLKSISLPTKKITGGTQTKPEKLVYVWTLCFMKASAIRVDLI